MMKRKQNSLDEQVFVCIDCESTGLDPDKDRIIEVAAARFTTKEVLGEVEWLIDPGVEIPEESIKIHNITEDMVRGQPPFSSVVDELIDFIGNHIIVGHAVNFDIQLIQKEAERLGKSKPLEGNGIIDTVRLARHYGESPSNSLENLRQHFNIDEMGAHRAMNDVQVNISVFRYLAKAFRSTKEIQQLLKKPVKLKYMPLGPHKGRLIKEVPLEFLKWGANKNFDEDLLFTIRSEIKRREKGQDFLQSSNPFLSLE